MGGQRVQDTSHLLLALDEGEETSPSHDVVITPANFKEVGTPRHILLPASPSISLCSSCVHAVGGKCECACAVGKGGDVCASVCRGYALVFSFPSPSPPPFPPPRSPPPALPPPSR